MGNTEGGGQGLMDMLRRIAGVVLIVVGVVVAVHTVVEPLYYVSTEASPDSPIWSIIDPFQGGGGRAGRDIWLHPKKRR